MERPFRLGVAAGALLSLACFTAIDAHAQVVVPPASEIPLPPKPESDSAKVRTDTIQPAFGRMPAPQIAEIGSPLQWDRDELFASGAFTVADLLERVPGATSFRTGWLASPKLVAVNGDFGRLRIFFDGLEIDDIDPRNGAVLDLNLVQIWTLEHVSVERLANELRVYLRSWQVDRTSPYTRTDVYTGDEDTNVYRGFYGKRFFNGAALQAAGHQYSTTAARLGGGGDALSFMVRTGVAKPLWSVDAVVSRTRQTRVLQPSFGEGLSIPDFDGQSNFAYLRGGIGKPALGPWLHLVASTMRLAETSRRTSAADALTRRVVADTADTTSSRNQYLLAAGYSRGVLQASVYDRVRSLSGESFHSPGARLELGNAIGLVTVSAERDGFRGATRGDAALRFSPLPSVAIAGAVSRATTNDQRFELRPPTQTSARVELGVRVFRAWLSAGYLTRDTALLQPPRVFDTAYTPTAAGRSSAGFMTLRGRIFKEAGVDIVATRWSSAAFYQPRYQARSEANLVTRWSSRFPSGNFGLKAAIVHDYRGDIAFPVAGGRVITEASGTVSGLLEIRIMRAVISYQVRNIAGELYQITPGFFMPRTINFYGVRWEFWN